MREINPSNHFLSSLAKLKQCGKCTGWMYEAQVNGWRVRVEPNPLNLADEIGMRLAKRKIYQTIVKGIDFELMARSAWHITKGDSKSVVLAEHDCRWPTIFEPAPLYLTAKSKEPNF
jgi:hypothetical protein